MTVMTYFSVLVALSIKVELEGLLATVDVALSIKVELEGLLATVDNENVCLFVSVYICVYVFVCVHRMM